MSTPSFMDETTVEAVAGGVVGPEAEHTLERALGQRLGAPATVIPTVSRSPTPASRLGRFTVLERLGAGGMGEVFAAYDPKLDRRVALKVLRREVGSDPDGDGETRLLREAQAMARVSHPNVIPVFDVGAFAGQIYVAMEHVAGVTLREWLTEPHTTAAVLAVFEQAGRGLAAAHAAGLVHRDFKPANVMVGDDGRVRVLDFGLARPTTESEQEVTEDDGRGEVVLDAQLTRTGVAMGTPAYMAPEQLEPRPVLDAKSDQFAFCVALYEALFGQPPFTGLTLAARLEQIRAGAVREPPADRKLPRAQRDALIRGLSARPAARFESMDALLAALRPRASRWRAFAAGGAAMASLTGLLVWMLVRDDRGGANEPPAPCLDAATPMTALWSPPRQQQLEARWSATGVAFAPAVWASVAPRVDDYVAQGSALRVGACEATRVLGTQSEELLDLRIACLDRGRRELGALLDVWARADAQTVATAVRAVSELPALEPCEDLEGLLEGAAPPGAGVAPQVEAGRERLAALRAEESAGHYRDAQPQAEAALLELATVPYPPLHAEAALTAGRLWFRRGKYDEARPRLERAYDLGLSLRHDEVAIEAASTLVLMLGDYQSRNDEALAWLHHASALLERSGGSTATRRNLARLRGLLLFGRGELDEALVVQQQSLREAEAELGPDDYETAMAHQNLGNLLSAVRRSEEAGEHYERARALFETIEGPEHPDVAQALHGLGDLATDAGKLDQARALYERAHEIRVRALGPDHLLVAFSLSRLAVVAIRQRRFDEAIVLARRSVEIAQAELGPDNLQVGRLLNNLGMAYIKSGQLEAAEQTNAQVLAIFERQLPVAHPHLLTARNNLATLRYERGDHEGALAAMRRVLEAQEQTLDPDDPALADTLDRMGVVLVGLERADEAVTLHERALTLREARQGAEHLGTAETLAYLAEALLARGDAARSVAVCERLLALEGRFEAPEVLANGRFVLAQAEWAVGEHAEARAEAQRARAAYAAIGLAEVAAEVDEWLAAR